MSKENLSEETEEQETPSVTEEIPEDELLEKRIEELESSLKRTMADFDNYRKRMLKERQRLVSLASESIIRDMLPILDDLERVLEADEEIDNDGLKLIHRKFKNSLNDHGLETIDAQGKEFDPYRHECMIAEEVEDEEKHDKILEELQKGYILNSNVIRPVKVKVGKYVNEEEVE